MLFICFNRYFIVENDTLRAEGMCTIDLRNGLIYEYVKLDILVLTEDVNTTSLEIVSNLVSTVYKMYQYLRPTDMHSRCDSDPLRSALSLIEYNTVQCDSIRYDSKRYETIRNETKRYDTIQYGAMRYDDTIQCNTTQYNTIQYDTIE